MHAIAPNLSALIGETVGARLISHAGALLLVLPMLQVPRMRVPPPACTGGWFLGRFTQLRVPCAVHADLCIAGSLVNLAKYPASTVQILGAEKALFRCGGCPIFPVPVTRRGAPLLASPHAMQMYSTWGGRVGAPCASLGGVYSCLSADTGPDAGLARTTFGAVWACEATLRKAPISPAVSILAAPA